MQPQAVFELECGRPPPRGELTASGRGPPACWSWLAAKEVAAVGRLPWLGQRSPEPSVGAAWEDWGGHKGGASKPVCKFHMAAAPSGYCGPPRALVPRTRGAPGAPWTVAASTEATGIEAACEGQAARKVSEIVATYAAPRGAKDPKGVALAAEQGAAGRPLGNTAGYSASGWQCTKGRGRPGGTRGWGLARGCGMPDECIPSRGSKNHYKMQCRPCKFHAVENSGGGCQNGALCNFCHFAHDEAWLRGTEAGRAEARLHRVAPARAGPCEAPERPSALAAPLRLSL